MSVIDNDVEATFPPRLALVYRAWKSGDDLRAVLPKNTFYRYRQQLLKLTDGLCDIRALQTKSNVVPLRRVLEAVPASPPSWASPAVLWRRTASQ